MIIPEQWMEISEQDKIKFQGELKREVCKNHILYGKTVHAIFKRIKFDDVLFKIESAPFQYCVVHLTWRVEVKSNCPSCIWFKNYDDFINVWKKIMCDEVGEEENWRFPQ